MEAHSQPADPHERDTTDEWRVAPARSTVSVAELEGRIDVALATARTAEEAALEIGAASLEAAEQARRAAAFAERASASAARAAESAREATVTSLRRPVDPAAKELVGTDEPADVPPARPSPYGAVTPRTDPFEDRIDAFRLRAEKVMLRLQKIEAGAQAA
jgi:hypothetical protein